jgi:hypothetical protein
MPTEPEPQPDPKQECEIVFPAEELRQQAERLHAIAEKMAKQFVPFEELQQFCDSYRRYCYQKLREHFEKTLEPLPDDVDLEAYALEHGGLPLEAFIDEIEHLAGPNADFSIGS